MKESTEVMLSLGNGGCLMKSLMKSTPFFRVVNGVHAKRYSQILLDGLISMGLVKQHSVESFHSIYKLTSEGKVLVKSLIEKENQEN